jgi:hypothetical protein
MRRRLWILPPAGVLALLAAHFAVWRYEAGQLDAGWAAWIADRRAAGWTVSTGAPERGGWPLAATLSVPQVALQGGEPDIPGGLAWSAERLELHVDLLSPGTLAVRADGAQHLRLADLPDAAYTADSTVALLPLEAQTPPHSVSLTVRNLRAGLPTIDPAASLTVGLVQFDGAIKPAAPAGEAALTWRLSTEAIALPALPSGRIWALGSRISSLSIEGAVDGPVPMARGLVPRATAWRDGGGTLEIKHLTMGWGPLGLSGAATLALDQRLQPMGTGSVRLVRRPGGGARADGERGGGGQGGSLAARHGARGRRAARGRGPAHLAGPHAVDAPGAAGEAAGADLAGALRVSRCAGFPFGTQTG